MNAGRPTLLLRASLLLVAAFFVAVQVRVFLAEDFEALSRVGDGTLFALAFLGHGVGTLLALAYGSFAFRRRLTPCVRVGISTAAAITLATMGLYWAYFEVIAQALVETI